MSRHALWKEVAGRAASGYVISIDGVARVLVDVVPGGFVRLGEMGIDFRDWTPYFSHTCTLITARICLVSSNRGISATTSRAFA